MSSHCLLCNRWLEQPISIAVPGSARNLYTALSKVPGPLQLAQIAWCGLLPLSGMLSAEEQHELNTVAQSLDSLRALEQLQQALFLYAVEGNPCQILVRQYAATLEFVAAERAR